MFAFRFASPLLVVTFSISHSHSSRLSLSSCLTTILRSGSFAFVVVVPRLLVYLYASLYFLYPHIIMNLRAFMTLA